MSANADYRGIDRLIGGLEEHGDAWLRAVAEEIKNDARLSFGTSPGGRVYRRRSVLHTASQPGYPPNVDIGALRASIGVKQMGGLWYVVHDGVKYGYFLEIGTERMRKRPWLRPAVERMRKRLFEHAQRFGLVQKLVK